MPKVTRDVRLYESAEFPHLLLVWGDQDNRRACAVADPFQEGRFLEDAEYLMESGDRAEWASDRWCGWTGTVDHLPDYRLVAVYDGHRLFYPNLPKHWAQWYIVGEHAEAMAG